MFVGPTFINIANAPGLDNCWLTGDDGLQLQAASSGIDVGDNAGLPLSDIHNFNRIFNGVVDMGAYEFNSTSLPVTLVNFYGSSSRNSNKLYWSTGSELNSHLFEVQKSRDAIFFEKIGEVRAAVNSNGLQKYQFIIDNVLPGNYFYRLKQLDKDGRFSYSKIILLATKDNIKEVSVFPNPIMKKATLYFGKSNFMKEEFLVINSGGQIIQKFFVNGNTGFINLEGKASGVYMLVNQKYGIAIKIYKVAEGK
ncbi:MAG: choice-of-anchor Q domain-containing protein [Chitinophagaceae bacterium]